MFSLTLNLFRRKDFDMAFDAKFQPVLDGINALKAQLATAVANEGAAAALQTQLDAANATIASLTQDASDTEAALQTAIQPPPAQ